MSFFRSLWADLVEKRLWPIALALLLALVAVPVLLGGGAQDGAAAVGATGTTGSRSDITLEATAPVRGNRDGVLRNPFKPRAKAPVDPAAAATTAATQTAAAPASSAPGSPGTPSGGGSSGSGGPGSIPTITVPTPTTSTPGPVTPAPKATDAYAAIIHFGALTGPKDTKVLGRLAPLKIGSTPFMIFNGVLPDRRTAVFLLSTDVKVAGDGVCQPRKSSCETVEMKAGDHELVVYTAPDGTKTSYSIALVAVDNSSATVAKAARAASVGQPRAAATTRAAVASSGYRFDQASGLLHRLPRSARLGAYGAAAVAQAAFAFGAPAGTTAP